MFRFIVPRFMATLSLIFMTLSPFMATLSLFFNYNMMLQLGTITKLHSNYNMMLQLDVRRTNVIDRYYNMML